MKLSEAIRLGSMATEQAFGETEDAQGRTCAMGGALRAVGRKYTSYMEIANEWPMAGIDAVCPIRGAQEKPVMVLSVIRYLNDIERWSRPRIADWVERIEQAQEQPEQETVATSVADTAPVSTSSSSR